MYIRSFRELIVWQRSMQVVTASYAIARHLPSFEQFGLSLQIRKSSVSVASNIAEGKKRGTRREFRRFLVIAEASAAELETQLLIAQSEYQVDA